MNPYESALRALLPHLVAIRQRPDNTPEFTRAVDHATSLFDKKVAPPPGGVLLTLLSPSGEGTS